MRHNYWRLAGICCTAAFALATVTVRADVVYNDTVNPDFSNVWNAPTVVTLPYGTSSVIFRTRLDELGVVDLDIFRVNLPAGSGLSHLFLASDEGDSGTSFIAIEAGPALTFNPLGNDGGDVNLCFTECLGYAHIGPNESFNGMGVGGDLLVGGSSNNGLDDSIAPANFTPPLTGSQYTFWSQEFNGDVTLKLDFVVAPIHGDYNHDGTTNAADYTVWRNSLGTTVVAGSGADGNGDGSITQGDYTIWKTNYAFMPGGGAGTAVPEPGSILLLLFGLVAVPVLARRRRIAISTQG